MAVWKPVHNAGVVIEKPALKFPLASDSILGQSIGKLGSNRLFWDD